MWVEMVSKVRTTDGREPRDLVSDLKVLTDAGIEVVSASGHLRVLAPEGENNPCATLERGEIEKAVQEVCGGHPYLRILEWECGGGFPRSGDAQCVGGLTGEPLKPFMVRRDGPDLVNGNHALFGSREGIVVARAKREDGDLDMQLFRHSFKGVKGLTESEPLFQYRVPDTVRGGIRKPEELDEFSIEFDWAFPLLSAATRKAWRWHCREVFYSFREGN